MTVVNPRMIDIVRAGGGTQVTRTLLHMAPAFR